MAKTFYSHIAETTEITLLIADMDMPKEDRIKLLRLVEENLHHNLLDLVLGSLSQEDKKTFLTHLAAEKHDSAWEFISSKIDDLENKIVDASTKFKNRLKRDIEKAKK